MHVIFYFPLIWLSGSFCALIGLKELDANAAAHESKSPGRQSWGSELTLGPEIYSKCSTDKQESTKLTTAHPVTNGAPNANILQAMRSGGPTTQAAVESKDTLNLELYLGRNKATHPPDDSVDHDRVSKKMKVSPVPYSRFLPYEEMWRSHKAQQMLLRMEKKQYLRGRPYDLSTFAGSYHDLMIPFTKNRFEINHFKNSRFKVVNGDINSSIFRQQQHKGPSTSKPEPQTEASGTNGNNRVETLETSSSKGKGKEKILNDQEKQISLENGMQENGMVTSTNRNAEIATQSSLESKPLQKPAVANPVTESHAESEHRKESYSLAEIKNYLNERNARWFRANIPLKSKQEKYQYVYVLHQLSGREIITKIRAMPKTVNLGLKLQKLRLSFQSQTLKSIVSFVDLMNSISHPPLYPNVQKLQEAQHEAFSFVKSLWEEIKMDEYYKPTGRNTNHMSFHSPRGKLAIKHTTTLRNFGFRESMQLSNIIFLMWLERYHNEIYKQVHASNNPMKWKPWIISCLNDKILSSKSLEEIEAQVNYEQDDLESDVFKNNQFFTYSVINPLKINWKNTQNPM